MSFEARVDIVGYSRGSTLMAVVIYTGAPSIFRKCARAITNKLYRTIRSATVGLYI